MKRILILCLLAVAVQPVRAESTILVFGDSISAGYGITPGTGWVTLLQTKLERERYGYRVINASVSGETTAGGLARLPRALTRHHPQVVIIELGGNDGLRALPIAPMRANLVQMSKLSRAAGAAVLLLGMRVPPNYGPQYTEQFRLAYTDVAHGATVALVPFLMDGIALSPGLMQADGIHPNQFGQPRLLANVWPKLQLLLRKQRAVAHSRRRQRSHSPR